ncbi:hypothetical protein CC86DRAFT_337183 [Ophiobolus disseminans]|uniref:Uncharacterized protein n=1 Tax=Ophiobolus disseminans TaxID=1469910 RepID=A0A6A6ZCQ6_9PLEO|nr:hypothetical protein CC86DRAFT_337183 [Ophiobolus disseminans]
MATKKEQHNEASKEKQSGSPGSKKKAVSDEEVRQESSKAANASMNAQKKAKELKAAAAGAGDPDERQKLTEQAVNAQIEAESFGKTAKYMRSGAFQGLAVGTGLGVAPGATLGAVTGTLVGGVTSTITGGLGGGIGTAAGALHGPIWNLGEVAGKGVRKFTGKLPAWVVSDEQKQSLEKMIGQVQEEDMPDENELQKLHEEGGSAMPDEGWMTSAKDMVSSLGSGDQPSIPGQQDDGEAQKGEASDARHEEPSTHDATTKADTKVRARNKPRKLEGKSNHDKDEEVERLRKERDEYKREAEAAQADLKGLRDQAAGSSGENQELVKQLNALQQKLEESQSETSAGSMQATKPKAQPRKLEKRS